MKTLALLRHAKSDWSTALADRDRPLAPRGRRQAPLAGHWLATQARMPDLDLAVVSVAERAQQTWALAAAAYDQAGARTAPPPVQLQEAAYTFSARDLADLITTFEEAVDTVVLVGHNPALEDLVTAITGHYLAMPTSCLAVVQGDSWVSLTTAGELFAYGRPPELTENLS